MVSMKMSWEDNTLGFKENHKKGLKMIKNRLIACLVLVCSFGCLASCSVDTSKNHPTRLTSKLIQISRFTPDLQLLEPENVSSRKSVMQMERRVDLFPKLTKWLKW